MQKQQEEKGGAACSRHHRRICPTSSHHAVPAQHGHGRGFTPAQQLPPRPRDLNITRGKEGAGTSLNQYANTA